MGDTIEIKIKLNDAQRIQTADFNPKSLAHIVLGFATVEIFTLSRSCEKLRPSEVSFSKTEKLPNN